MSEDWDDNRVRALLKERREALLCDVLLDQTIFAGAGNIIKNEVLFNLKLHPEKQLASLTPRMRTKMICEMRDYCFRFYEWKKAFVLKKNWKIYRKRKCPTCDCVAWLYTPLALPLAQQVPHRLMVYDCMDRPCRSCRTWF